MFNFSMLSKEQILKLKNEINMALSPEGSKILLDEVFAKYDINKDGYLDRKELRKYVESTFNELKICLPLTDEYLDDIFISIDKNHDYKIQRDEMEEYLKKFAAHIKPIVENALK